MIIRSDEDSLARMLNVEPADLPDSVREEYEVRIHLYHCDGASGPLGSLALIAMLRSMNLGRRPAETKPPPVDWSRVPWDGSVRVTARITNAAGDKQQASGAFVGEERGGMLAIRLDGDAWVHSIPRNDVQVARGEPVRPLAPEDAHESTVPIAEREPWVSLDVGESVLITDKGVEKEGKFQSVDGDQILVLVAGDLTPRPFPHDQVQCLNTRLAAIAKKKQGEGDAATVHGGDND